MRYGALTVGELIEALQELPDTCPVYMRSEAMDAEGYWDATAPVKTVFRGLEDVELR